MSDSLFSSSWYRVANVRPRLRNHAQIHRHVYRGEVWYVLQNHSTGKFHRFSAVANAVIGLMDGRRTIQEIWDIACARLGDEVPTQDEMIKLLSDLHRADILQTDTPPDLLELNRRRKMHGRMRWKQYLGNPLSLRFRLFDPDSLLGRLAPYCLPFFGRFGAMLYVGLIVWALVLAAMHWNELSSDVIDRVFAVDNLLLLWLVFPVIKLLHELGHGIATKVGGGEVHEMGVMLLVLMPIPYVDASAATGFRDKRSRALVGAAGMLVELLVAALAMIAWVNLSPGVERAMAYNVMLVAGVSTLLFNGNPLLRYDGYYILADYLEIPNLGQRANEYLGYLVNHYLFAVDGLQTPTTAPGEQRWFVFYGLASFAYRMFMMVSIALLVAGKFFFIGVVLALWAMINMLVVPAAKKLSYLFTSPSLTNQRRRALLVSGSVALFLGGGPCLASGTVGNPYGRRDLADGAGPGAIRCGRIHPQGGGRAQPDRTAGRRPCGMRRSRTGGTDPLAGGPVERTRCPVQRRADQQPGACPDHRRTDGTPGGGPGSGSAQAGRVADP